MHRPGSTAVGGLALAGLVTLALAACAVPAAGGTTTPDGTTAPGGTTAPTTSPAPPDAPSAPGTSATATLGAEGVALTVDIEPRYAVPDLTAQGGKVGKAHDRLAALGAPAPVVVDATGAGRAVVDRWRVCTQDPAAGTRTRASQTVTLTAVLPQERCP